MLLVLGGARLACHWPRVAPGVRRGTARGVWRVVQARRSARPVWLGGSRAFHFRLYYFAKAKIGLRNLVIEAIETHFPL